MITLPDKEYEDIGNRTVCTMLQKVKHTIGMDSRNTYRRHDKTFYKPYRNYFTTIKSDRSWDLLVEEGYAEKYEGEKYDEYSLTRKGLDWLGEHIGVIIRDPE